MLMNINQMAICLTAGRSDGSALMVIGVSNVIPRQLHWWLVYSAIQQFAGLPIAVRNGLQRVFLPAAAIHSQWTCFLSTGIVAVKVKNDSASGFMNRAVCMG